MKHRKLIMKTHDVVGRRERKEKARKRAGLAGTAREGKATLMTPLVREEGRWESAAMCRSRLSVDGQPARGKVTVIVFVFDLCYYRLVSTSSPSSESKSFLFAPPRVLGERPRTNNDGTARKRGTSITFFAFSAKGKMNYRKMINRYH